MIQDSLLDQHRVHNNSYRHLLFFHKLYNKSDGRYVKIMVETNRNQTPQQCYIFLLGQKAHNFATKFTYQQNRLYQHLSSSGIWDDIFSNWHCVFLFAKHCTTVTYKRDVLLSQVQNNISPPPTPTIDVGKEENI